ncbi:MAG: FxDxF family PEP-CTERM protein [Rhizobacter sp.]|nr:FxDxF family PEP-CTERM protein [Rhizobacter sp.]
MKFKVLAFLLALFTVGSASAACTQSFSLGVMGPPSVQAFGNSFDSVQHFEDCYNFTLSGPADAFGATFAIDLSSLRNITIGSLTLTGGSLVNPLFDSSASGFSFSNLAAGVYQFVVSGDVTGSNGSSWGPLGYIGALATTSSVAAPVPEPKTYALLALGLLAVGWTVRRRNQA